jgi:hypothetical protein
MKRRVLQNFSEKQLKKTRRFIPFITIDNVISNEFPEPVEGNEVKNLLAFSRIKFLLINLSLVTE